MSEENPATDGVSTGLVGSATGLSATEPAQAPARTHARGKTQVWVRMAGHWLSVFASDNRDEAARFAREQVRHGGNVCQIELRDPTGAVPNCDIGSAANRSHHSIRCDRRTTPDF